MFFLFFLILTHAKLIKNIFARLTHEFERTAVIHAQHNQSKHHIHRKHKATINKYVQQHQRRITFDGLNKSNDADKLLIRRKSLFLIKLMKRFVCWSFALWKSCENFWFVPVTIALHGIALCVNANMHINSTDTLERIFTTYFVRSLNAFSENLILQFITTDLLHSYAPFVNVSITAFCRCFEQNVPNLPFNNNMCADMEGNLCLALLFIVAHKHTMICSNATESTWTQNIWFNIHWDCCACVCASDEILCAPQFGHTVLELPNTTDNPVQPLSHTHFQLANA